MKIIKYLKSKIYGFPLKIKEVYLFYELCYRKESKYCVDLWKDIDWVNNNLVPMFKKGNKIAWYKIISSYYKYGNSMSDWAWGDDGKYRDFEFHHITIK